MRILVVAGALLLAACAEKNYLSESIPASWQDHTRIALHQKTFTRSGILHAKHKKFHFSWTSETGYTKLRIGEESGTFYKITLDKNGGHITGTNGIDFVTHEPETALSELLGFYIPLQSFQYWLKGIDDPQYVLSKRKFYPTGEMATLHQNDWQISLRDYNNGVPNRLTFERGNLSLFLVLEKS